MRRLDPPRTIGPVARFLAADHVRLHGLLETAVAGAEGVSREPFDRFRAGILRHISMEEKRLIPALAAASGGRRPALAALLRVDHGAITALLVPPPTREIVAELRAILDRHDRCEESDGGLYDLGDRALGEEASLRLVAELERHPPVLLRPYQSSARIANHVRRSVAASWDAWARWNR